MDGKERCFGNAECILGKAIPLPVPKENMTGWMRNPRQTTEAGGADLKETDSVT